jgi:hypothetical protein
LPQEGSTGYCGLCLLGLPLDLKERLHFLLLNFLKFFYFSESGYAVDQDTYLKECVSKRLIPNIRSNYEQGEYVFWPDKASSHYANKVINHLRQEQIGFVEKEENPSNFPEARSIEDFWGILKEDVYAKG